VTSRYLAFDLGAESGRAVLGELRSGVLSVRETHRFANEPVRDDDSLRWNVVRLRAEVQRALDGLSALALDGIGLDTWGVDYALLDKHGSLLENPYHYRDKRTDGVMEAVLERVPRERIYSATGIQFLPFNTLYQLYAACRSTPHVIDSAESLLTTPDLFNYWLTGKLSCEYTIATTTQMVDPVTRTWALDLLADLDLPTRLLLPLTEPGSIIGPLRSESSRAGTPLIAPACHDTGSAVAAVASSGRSAFLSSGTWSLLGAELPRPVITPEAREMNFTNEGGVCGTVRFLKNITGLWLLQSCRHCWAAEGNWFSYDALLSAAAEERRCFRSLIDPDCPVFLHPANMLTAIDEYCMRTSQPAPDGPPAYALAILESLAFKYRAVLDSMERLTGLRFEEVRVVGGGSKNRLLNQFTADATGRTVIAGPAEATALGNIAMQMLATGAVSSLAEARQVIDRSFPVERFEPRDPEIWTAQNRRFQQYLDS